MKKIIYTLAPIFYMILIWIQSSISIETIKEWLL